MLLLAMVLVLPQDSLTWEPTVRGALDLAKQGRKLVAVDLSRPSDPSTDPQRAAWFGDPSVRPSLATMVLCRPDGTGASALVRRFRSSFPMVLAWVDSEGEPRGLLAGPCPPALVAVWVSSVREADATHEALVFHAKSRLTEREAMKLAFSYASRLDPERASSYLNSYKSEFRSEERDRAWAAVAQAWSALGKDSRAEEAWLHVEPSRAADLSVLAKCALAEIWCSTKKETALARLQQAEKATESPIVRDWTARRIREIDQG